MDLQMDLGFVVDSDPVVPSSEIPPPAPIGMVNRDNLKSDAKGFYYDSPLSTTDDQPNLPLQ